MAARGARSASCPSRLVMGGSATGATCGATRTASSLAARTAAVGGFAGVCEPKHAHPERPKVGRLEPEEWRLDPEQQNAASRVVLAGVNPSAQERVRRGLVSEGEMEGLVLQRSTEAAMTRTVRQQAGAALAS
eukprot:3547040-Alexandrium_andersonii.AAC.1